jgi:hypothetical protein
MPSVFKRSAPANPTQRSARLSVFAHSFDLSKPCQDSVWQPAQHVIVSAGSEKSSASGLRRDHMFSHLPKNLFVAAASTMLVNNRANCKPHHKV